MIKVHKLNGSEVVINAELIECLEPGPETVVSLATGNRFLVRETVDELTAKIVEYRRKINSENKVVNPIAGFERG
ncbi:MAG: flagellar FlbD family protein [Elusimicrobiota bacterium]|jgi:flagellar protein FlbD